MTQTKKFSQFNGPSPIQPGDIVVGLRNDGTGFYDNWQFTGVGGGGGGGGGITIIVDQPTAGLMPGQWVRRDPLVNPPGAIYTPALANNSENAEIVGCVLNILNANQFTLQVIGYVGHGMPGFSGFTPGGVYFLSDMTPGLITLVEPTANGSVSLPCFIAETSDSGWIRQSRGMIIAGTGPIPPSGGGGTDNTQHTVNQPGNTFEVGDWVRVILDTIYTLADGTTLNSSQAIGVVTSVSGALFTVQQSGWSNLVVTEDDQGNPLVPGTVYYLSATVPGQITSTPPSTLGFSTRPVFISESATNQSGWIFPQRPLEVGGDNQGIVFVNQPAHGFTLGQVLYINATNNYALAIATSLATSDAVGFVVLVQDADNFVLQTSGLSDAFIAPFTPLVPPAQYYLSDATPGAITQTEPSALTSYSKPMLAPLNATTGYILEQRPLLNSVLHPSGSGGVIQSVSKIISSTITSVSALNYGLPFASTGIPTFSLTITPTNASNYLRLIMSASSTGAQGIWRSDVPGFAVQSFPAFLNYTIEGAVATMGYPSQVLYIPANTTSPITFNLALGKATNGPGYLNVPIINTFPPRAFYYPGGSIFTIEEVPAPL